MLVVVVAEVIVRWMQVMLVGGWWQGYVTAGMPLHPVVGMPHPKLNPILHGMLVWSSLLPMQVVKVNSCQIHGFLRGDLIRESTK